jgi:hypothetical protein
VAGYPGAVSGVVGASGHRLEPSPGHSA